MFKFFDDRTTIRILVESLSAYDPFYPYDDSHYSYHFKDDLFHVKVKFPYREDIHEKYTFIYDVKTNHFDVEPNDLNIKVGSFAYKRLQKALVKACRHSINRTQFFNTVYSERNKMAKFITNDSVGSDSGRKNSKNNNRNSKSKTSCNPFVRDVFLSSSDSGGSSSNHSHSSGTHNSSD
jgi:hypothetical protein